MYTTKQKEYDANNTIQLKVKLNKKTDADIIAKLNEVPKKATYIKNLIRRDLNENINIS